MRKDALDDAVNEEDFCNVDDQDGYFLQYPPFCGNVNNQAKPFPQPPSFFNNKREVDRKQPIKYIYNEVNYVQEDVRYARHDINTCTKDIQDLHD